MVVEIILLIIVLITFLKEIYCFYYLYIANREKKNISYKDAYNGKTLKLLIVIPVLREQSVIQKTLEHFKNLQTEHLKLTICIAGTMREDREKEKYKKSESTKEIVERWIAEYNKCPTSDLEYYFSEANDKNGDRASQLNYAVEYVSTFMTPDIIGVYDADSLPDGKTLNEVMNNYVNDNTLSYQQPVHFIKAANSMAVNKSNPILVANALYQTDWTMIRELPRWSSYHQYCNANRDGIYNRNVYLIGHGEFVPFEIYKEFKFPENEVTDGIQLGYRLAMSQKNIAPLHTFCEDDVPRSVHQLVSQHKRWFGGCMRLLPALKWSRTKTEKNAFGQMIDGYWSQMSWAFAAIISILGIVLSVIDIFRYGNYVLPLMEIGLVLVYCYIIPVISHSILSAKIKVRAIDWICLPIAIALKGIGPNLYIFQWVVSKITQRQVDYVKVER